MPPAALKKSEKWMIAFAPLAATSATYYKRSSSDLSICQIHPDISRYASHLGIDAMTHG